MPAKGTYGVYEKVRPFGDDTSKIGEAFERSKLANQASRREDEKLKLSGKIQKQRAKKENKVDLLEIDDFNAFAGEMGAAAQRLKQKAGTMLVQAQDMVENGTMTQSAYYQLQVNMDAGVGSWNEISNSRKDNYQSLFDLDSNDYYDGVIDDERERLKAAFLNAKDVDFNSKGELVYMIEDKDGNITETSIGDFYNQSEPIDIKERRYNIYDDITTDAYKKQFLWGHDVNGKPVWWGYDQEGKVEAQVLNNTETLVGDRIPTQVGWNADDLKTDGETDQEAINNQSEDMHTQRVKSIHLDIEKPDYQNALATWEEKERKDTGTKIKPYYQQPVQADVKPINQGGIKGKHYMPVISIDKSSVPDYPINGSVLKKSPEGILKLDADGKVMSSGNIKSSIGSIKDMIVTDDGQYIIRTAAKADKDLSDFVVNDPNLSKLQQKTAQEDAFRFYLQDFSKDDLHILVSKDEFESIGKRITGDNSIQGLFGMSEKKGSGFLDDE